MDGEFRCVPAAAAADDEVVEVSGLSPEALPTRWFAGGRRGRQSVTQASDLGPVVGLGFVDQAFHPGEVTALFGRHVSCQLVVKPLGNIQGDIERHGR